MLQEYLRLTYPRAHSHRHTRELLHKLMLAEDKEEAKLFRFRMYYANNGDFEFFEPADRERVKGFLQFLTEDTRHQKEIISEMIEEIKGWMEVENGSRTT